MKKAGSSSSKSKTLRTSKSSATPKAEPGAREPQASPSKPEYYVGQGGQDEHENTSSFEGFAVGHNPPAGITDEARYRAFQSNLLSLISHELRTPLMGILNSLGLLEEDVDSNELSSAELVKMARQNAQRLHRTLSSLLDLAALDSGTFHARLREVDLRRVVSSRLDTHRALFRDRGVELENLSVQAPSTGVLGDPQKLGRAIDLCLQALVPRAEPGARLQLRISLTTIELSTSLTAEAEPHWDQAWTHASAGFQGGVGAPGSAFAGVLQSEQAFLTRMEEGLGSEFLLVHEILKLHRGHFRGERKGRKVRLELELPELASEEGVHAVLASRAFSVSTELASVALVLMTIPEGASKPEEFTAEVKKNLFRSSDAAYLIREKGQVALVLDDCKAEDAPRLMERIVQKLAKTVSSPLHYGVAQCPSDSPDPSQLLLVAQSRLREASDP